MTEISNARMSGARIALQWMGTVMVVAGALVAAEGRLFFGDGYHFGGQFADSFALHRLASESLRAGHLQRWSPNLLSGYPLHAALAVSPFYPPAALLLLSDPSYRLFELYAVLHLLIGGVAMGVLLSRLGCSWVARTLGAICYATCGFNLAQLGHTASFAMPAAWLPLVLLAWHGLAREPTLRRAALAAVASALPLLEGHLQIALYAEGFGLAWYTWQRLGRTNGSGGRSLVRSLILPVAALSLAAALAAPRLLPSAAFLKETATPEDQSEAMRAPLQPHELLTLPWPGISRAMHQIWGERASVEAYAYVGVVPLFLSVLGVSARQGRFFAVSALLAVAAASGAVESANGLLSQVGLPVIRSQTRPLLIFDVSLSVLAALGLDRLRSLSRRRLRGALAAVATVLLLSGSLAATLGGVPREALRGYMLAAAPGCAFLIVAAAALGLLRRAGAAAALVLVIADVSYFSHGLPQPFRWSPEKTFVQYRRRPLRDLVRTTPVPRLHTASLHGPSNAPLVAGLHTTTAWVGWRRVPWRYALLLRELGPSDGYHDALLPLMSAPYVLAERSRPVPRAFALLPVEGLTGAFKLLRYDAALPRAYVAHVVHVVPSWHQALDLLQDGELDLRAEVVLEIVDAPSERISWGTGSGDSVAFRVYDDNHLMLEATLGAPGVLILLETFCPGWRATVDGDPAPVLPAQLAFRGILMQAGTHVVEMHFRDRNLTVGLALSAAAVLAVGVFLAEPALRSARGKLSA